ncbi:MAG: carbohydrate ABC transporter permease [Clostridia bacterium]|nr:carbohydrate ABC transporter permease [Clostridia bacterium]
MNMQKRFTRSRFGSAVNLIILVLIGLFMVFPMVYTINNAFKPTDELFMFPPNLFVRNPTLDNFLDFSVLMRDSVVPMSRYFVNSFLITLIGVAGQVVLASLAAYMISKHDFFGRNVLMEMVILSLMFTGSVTAIPNYIIMTKLHLINTHLSIILPAFCSSMGLFLMKQFIDQMIPHSLLEAARLDGAGELYIFFRIVMPICKPAWMTLIIFSFQSLWNNAGSTYIFDEELKTLPYAFNNVASSGLIARAGVTAAVGLLMILPPIVTFVITQSNVLETMATSGIKD